MTRPAVAALLNDKALEIARAVLHREMNGEPGDAVAACIKAYLGAALEAPPEPNEELAFQLWLRFGNRDSVGTDEAYRKLWPPINADYWRKQTSEILVAVRGEAPPEPNTREADRREAAAFQRGVEKGRGEAGPLPPSECPECQSTIQGAHNVDCPLALRMIRKVRGSVGAGPLPPDAPLQEPGNGCALPDGHEGHCEPFATTPTDADEPPWPGWFSCPDCWGWFYGEPNAFDSGDEVCGACADRRDPVALNDAALTAAERAYWKDDGVSRHNLGVAILAYLGAMRGVVPAPPPEPLEWLLSRIEALTEDQAAHLLDVWSEEIPGNWRQQLFLDLTTEAERQSGRAVPAPPPEPRPDEVRQEGRTIVLVFEKDGDASQWSRAYLYGAVSTLPPEPDDIEAIRSDETVRDAFVECYTLRGIVDEDVHPDERMDDHWLGEWDRVESALIRAILGRAVSAPQEGPP